MKRYIHPITINIDVFVDHLLLHVDDFSKITATIDRSEYNLPSRPIIVKDRNRVEGWMINDFEAFVEDVEDLCEHRHGLILTYKNVSDYNSHYYNYLATDKEGNIITKIRLRLRIADHDPKRSKEQKKHKKEELNSERLNELLTKEQISDLTTYTKIITVNDSIYDSYEDAFDDVNKILKHAVEVMRR